METTHSEQARDASDGLKVRLDQALRRQFPNDTVDISDGYADNVHVLVVSRRFDPMSEDEKQDFLWSLIDQAGLSDDEKSRISLVLPFSPSELK